MVLAGSVNFVDLPRKSLMLVVVRLRPPPLGVLHPDGAPETTDVFTSTIDCVHAPVRRSQAFIRMNPSSSLDHVGCDHLSLNWIVVVETLDPLLAVLTAGYAVVIDSTWFDWVLVPGGMSHV